MSNNQHRDEYKIKTFQFLELEYKIIFESPAFQRRRNEINGIENI
jgi:hypothetical protein